MIKRYVKCFYIRKEWGVVVGIDITIVLPYNCNDKP